MSEHQQENNVQKYQESELNQKQQIDEIKESQESFVSLQSQQIQIEVQQYHQDQQLQNQGRLQNTTRLISKKSIKLEVKNYSIIEVQNRQLLKYQPINQQQQQQLNKQIKTNQNIQNQNQKQLKQEQYIPNYQNQVSQQTPIKKQQQIIQISKVLTIDNKKQSYDSSTIQINNLQVQKINSLKQNQNIQINQYLTKKQQIKLQSNQLENKYLNTDKSQPLQSLEKPANSIIIQSQKQQVNQISQSSNQIISENEKLQIIYTSKISKSNQKQEDTSSPSYQRKIPDKIKGSYYLTIVQQKNKNEKVKSSLPAQKSLIKDIYNIQLPELKGKISFYTKDSHQLIQTSYVVNYVEFYLTNITSFMIKSIQKIKVLKNQKGLIELKVSYYGIDLKKMLEMKKKKVVIQNYHDQKDNEVIFFVFSLNNYEQTFNLFSGLIVRKFLLSSFLVNEPFSSYQKRSNSSFNKIEGQIYKSSRILKSWKKQKVILTDQLRILNGNKVSYSLKSIKQLWTRFDMYNGHFVMKVWSGLQKIEFGIPILNYTNANHSQNWLFGFYKLLAQ